MGKLFFCSKLRAATRSLFGSWALLPAVLGALQIHAALTLRMLDLGRGSSV